MMDNLATREEIEKHNRSRSLKKGKRTSKAPENAGLTKEQTKKALRSLPRSGQKIPKKLVSKLPS